MKNRPTLLILAAGMGSRYGGLKQLDQLGPNGETIMDYSVKDAISAGFDRVVFVIRKSMEDTFCESIIPKYRELIRVDYVFQELDSLPDGFTPHPERVKPYGTAHAFLMAKKAIDTPFTVINADDFYGADAFQTIAGFLQEENGDHTPQCAMVGYRLEKTLSENGSVSRGVCQTDDHGNLTCIREMYNIRKEGDTIITENDGVTTTLPAGTPVSMNFWGFHPSIFPLLEELFRKFLTENSNNLTAEFQIPSVINHIILNQLAKVKVLSSTAEWFGVTYAEDRETVVRKLKEIYSILK
ncbi:NTP transferase domain-containing protein [Bacteroidales bacterium OttesenSCG-928-B11]|nr:NTP transferase domain-containing protein [Bacteroidales bacterium OttesenSCG-928-E04]MDL2308219.1 NTP transferase domain-containing protein [Bacteroidales bacterium OttesenSCG-928-C03]MDL2311519.1 NTP transferase domain-containing protein [Bacteroidales bacterium OttesenSCG-928-B11]MDL2325658.1 NTP transferase domain-containing protein [Bacteroidales bacterium OttesenSCG-928-A14]